MPEKYKEPDRIKQYMASLEANLHAATGKSLAQWIKVAKSGPEGTKGAKIRWLKKEHGLGMSRATLVVWRAFGEGSLGEEDPKKLVANLFSKSFEDQRDLYEKVAAFVGTLGPGSLSPRKSYVALYRLKQFGAIKPSKNGLMIGIALLKYPKSKRLVEVKNFGGGDRNKMALILASVKDLDAEAKSLIKAAYDES